MNNDLSQPSPHTAVDSVATNTTSAPDEALIREIAWQWKSAVSQEVAVEAIREYIRRSAGKEKL